MEQNPTRRPLEIAVAIYYMVLLASQVQTNYRQQCLRGLPL